MGTLTNGVISTTYKNIVFQKTDNKIYYTSASDVDTEISTFASEITFSAGAIMGTTLKSDIIGEKTDGNGVSIESVLINDGSIKLGAIGKIYDSGGNEALHVSTVLSAVNYLQLLPSATGNSVILDTGGDDTNVGLTFQTKGSGTVRCVPALAIGGDLTVEGDDIIIGDADDGDVDKTINFRHDTCEVFMGVDDSQDSEQGAFVIHTGGTFETVNINNDFLIDRSGHVHIGNGQLRVGSLAFTDGDTALTINDGGSLTTETDVTIKGNLTFTGTRDVIFPDTSGLDIKDAGGSTYMQFINDSVAIGQPLTCAAKVEFKANSVIVPGAGITEAAGEVYRSWTEFYGVSGIDGLIKTSIYLDLTDLRHTATNGVVGKNGTSNPCYIAKVTAANTGTIVSGKMTCLEVPDATAINAAIYRSTSGTIVESTAASGMAGSGMVCDGGDQAIGEVTIFTNSILPNANDYLYFVCDGSGADADYTKGKFLIEMWGTTS